MTAPHSKSEAKRLAVMANAAPARGEQRVRSTWFAVCDCAGDTARSAGMRVECGVCGLPWVAVPHIVEDRIKEAARAQFARAYHSTTLCPKCEQPNPPPRSNECHCGVFGCICYAR